MAFAVLRLGVHRLTLSGSEGSGLCLHLAHAGKGWSLRLSFLCNHKHNVPEAQVKIPIQEAGFAEILRLFGLIAGAPIWHFKTNEAGTTTTLAEDSAHNRIAGKLR